jgi:hypothetical protein
MTRKSFRRALAASFALLMLAAHAGAGAVALDGENWRIATDPQNHGRSEHWERGAVAGAKSATVPSILQQYFPAYHGVAWYWRNFDPPPAPHAGDRYLLHFAQVDYLATVWVNGKSIGGHEGGETPFDLDVTDAILPGKSNTLAVRVLNPTNEPIDGIVLNQTPKQARVVPYHAGAEYDCGGITGSVELRVVRAIYLTDVFAKPDTKSGMIHITAGIMNAGNRPAQVKISFSLESGPASAMIRDVPAGSSSVEVDLHVENPRRWDLNDPFLYRVTARVASADEFDTGSVRCGFREFVFKDGTFRLNGRRIFLKSAHNCSQFPVGQRIPLDLELARKDVLQLKAMGFNMIRFIWGGASPAQLDLCDEVGLMVYEESFASWPMEPSPQMEARWSRSISELIRRDRNHPSVVTWGLLNETFDGPAFRLALGSLPIVRALDDDRMVFLNSGRFDLMSALDSWRTDGADEPWIVHNPRNEFITSPYGFDVGPQQVVMHPGPHGEYSVARWTAPAADLYDVSATFQGLPRAGPISAPATVDVHVMQQEKPIFSSRLNCGGSNANDASFSKKGIDVGKGQTIDFVVGFGNGNFGSDSTGLSATIASGSARYDVASDFSADQNPAGAWSYGTFRPGTAPDTTTFTAYSQKRNGPPPAAGSLANPGSSQWEDVVSDTHNYLRVPHSRDAMNWLRTIGGGLKPVFLSEYGVGSAVNYCRVVHQFEEIGHPDAEDAIYYRDKLNRYLADFARWKLQAIFPQPEDFFLASERRMAEMRTIGLNAIRSNPNIVGHSMTAANDHVSCGEGLTTAFREFKPGIVEAMTDAWSPLRWCLFAEPPVVYRGEKVKIEAVLANEDALPAGDYPARVQVVGSTDEVIFDRRISVHIPKESSFAIPVLSEEIIADAKTGDYRIGAKFEKGIAAGGETARGFAVIDRAEMPAVEPDVVLFGDDPPLVHWFADHHIRARAFDIHRPLGDGEVILISGAPPQDTESAFAELARRITNGAHAVCLTTDTFTKEDQPLGWAPFDGKEKPSRVNINSWLYQKDDWAKRGPAFAGLPAGGLMNYVYYREIIPDAVIVGGPGPDEAIAGAIKASEGYSSGLTLAAYRIGKGRLILNTLRIRENLGTHPAAERLLRNLLNDAATEQAN